MTVCSTGGMRNGLMVAKAHGASCGGLARVVLQAYDAVARRSKDFLERTIQEIRIAMLLTGSKTIAELQQQPLSSVTDC